MYRVNFVEILKGRMYRQEVPNQIFRGRWNSLLKVVKKTKMMKNFKCYEVLTWGRTPDYKVALKKIIIGLLYLSQGVSECSFVNCPAREQGLSLLLISKFLLIFNFMHCSTLLDSSWKSTLSPTGKLIPCGIRCITFLNLLAWDCLNMGRWFVHLLAVMRFCWTFCNCIWIIFWSKL